MKFINFAFIALASVSLVNSRAINEKRTLNDKQQCDNKLCYWISGPNGGTATLVGFNTKKNNNAKSLTIPSSVKFEGYTYVVDSVLNTAFSGDKNLQSVTVASNVASLKLSHRSFAECSNLKSVVFSNNKVVGDSLTAFIQPNKDITFMGKGIMSYADDQALRLIKDWDFKVQDFSKIDDYHRKEILFKLGKKVINYLSTGKIADGGNALTAMKVKIANEAGYARLFRLLAIAMGYPSKEILVGSDTKNNYFNYVKLDGYWYNIDVQAYPFNDYKEYYEAEWKNPLFVDKATQKKRMNSSVNPSSWYVLFGTYGHADEFRGQQSYDIFDQYLRQYKLGERK